MKKTSSTSEELCLSKHIHFVVYKIRSDVATTLSCPSLFLLGISSSTCSVGILGNSYYCSYKILNVHVALRNADKANFYKNNLLRTSLIILLLLPPIIVRYSRSQKLRQN